MSSKLLTPGPYREHLETHWLEDDFVCDFVSGDKWTAILTDSGTAAIGDAAGGILSLACSDVTVADNDEAYIKGTKETFLFAASKTIELVVRAQYTEANTDDANVIIGMANAVAANYLVDNGAGPPSNYYGFNVHKVDGGTKWICEASIGTTQYTTTSTTTAGGSSAQSFRMVFLSNGTDEAIVTFEVDTAGGKAFVPMLDSSGNEIVHRLSTLGTPTEMQVGIGAKNGDTNLETLTVDYVYAGQRR